MEEERRLIFANKNLVPRVWCLSSGKQCRCCFVSSFCVTYTESLVPIVLQLWHMKQKLVSRKSVTLLVMVRGGSCRQFSLISSWKPFIFSWDLFAAFILSLREDESYWHLKWNRRAWVKNNPTKSVKMLNGALNMVADNKERNLQVLRPWANLHRQGWSSERGTAAPIRNNATC